MDDPRGRTAESYVYFILAIDHMLNEIRGGRSV
jgi:hypothetical protein